MRWLYAVGYLIGCHQNYRRYVADALTDESLERRLAEWAEAC